MTPETISLIFERDDLVEAVRQAGVDGGEATSEAICALEAFDMLCPLNVKTLNKWGIVTPADPYMAPEERAMYAMLTGESFDGEMSKDVTTSLIVGMAGKYHVITHSGSIYELQTVDPAYEALYPNALARLAASAPQL